MAIQDKTPLCHCGCGQPTGYRHMDYLPDHRAEHVRLAVARVTGRLLPRDQVAQLDQMVDDLETAARCVFRLDATLRAARTGGDRHALIDQILADLGSARVALCLYRPEPAEPPEPPQWVD